MRIIAGKNKGRKIIAPSNLPVRPTTDFAKEALFNILNHTIQFDGLEVLDLFAGTGNISYEFLSRNVNRVTAIDNDYNCIKFIQQMASKLNYNNINAIRTDYKIFLRQSKIKWDLIFADPPYEMKEVENIPLVIFENRLIKPGGLFILEHSKSLDFRTLSQFSEHREYGMVNFSFFTENK